MKPKTIDEILNGIYFEYSYQQKEAKQQLIELFMSCVPKARDSAQSNIHIETYREAWRDYETR